jgi:type I restriction enzyme S subunit
MDGRKWIITTERYLSDNGLEAVKNSLVPPRSVAVSCIGSDMGKAVMVEKSSVTNQQINTIVVDEIKYNAEFVYYNLSARQEELKGIASGSATPILNKGHFSNVNILLPSKNDQNAIVDILRSIDDKIELNRQINQTLEEMAQAIFKSWFVDFEPVKAKIEAKANGQDPERAAMCAISGKTDAELDLLPHDQLAQLRATAALFPDELTDSELGLAPKGWEVKTVEDLSTIVAMGPFGSNIKVSTFVNEGVPVISGTHLNGTLLEDSEFNYVTESHAERLKKSVVYRGDVIFTHAGSIGQVAYIPDKSKYEKYVLSQRQFYMRPDSDQISSLFIVQYFKSHIGQHNLLANTSQVGVPSISRPVSYLRTIKLVVPGKELSDIYDGVVRPLHTAYTGNINQEKTLIVLRDTLLPKLLSGEIELAANPISS